MTSSAHAWKTPLEPLFRPRAVAVIGASRRTAAIGHLVVRNLIDFGFTGPIYPVNPAARSVRGIRCHAALDEVPDEVDLAVLVVPAEAIPEALEACGRKGVRAAVVISAGFKESGGEGARRERELRERAAALGIRLVGPNCMGVIDTHPEVRLNASFAAEFPQVGSVAFASQSGALGEVLLARARELDLGLSAFASLGNKADVGGNDLLEWWGEDPRTRVILLYLESLDEPRRFAELARRITRAGKPVLMVKSGRTAAGARASASHTGALAGVDRVMTTFLEQCGVLRVTRVEGLFDLARAFAHQPVPRGPRVAIVTNAGGPGIMAADAATAYGLEIATLSAQTVTALEEVLPPEASTANPVDTIATAGAHAFGACVASLLTDPGVDALLPIYVGPGNTDVRAVAEEVVRKVALAREVGAGGKPVLACFMGGRAAEARGVFQQAGIPAYDFPEDAAQALGAMARFRRWLGRPPGTVPSFALDLARIEELLAGPPGWLPPERAFALLEAAGIPVAARAHADSPEEAGERAAALGAWPLVLKWDHPDHLHKSEGGGVRLGLRDSGEVVRAAEQMAATLGATQRGGRFLLQRQVEAARELILGAQRDPAVGPVVVVGLGGIHTEVLGDVALRVLPLTDRDAGEMLAELRGAPLLRGHRGAPGVDLPAVEDALLRLAALVEACPRIAELDVNPLLAHEPGGGVVAVDARVRTAG